MQDPNRLQIYNKIQINNTQHEANQNMHLNIFYNILKKFIIVSKMFLKKLIY